MSHAPIVIRWRVVVGGRPDELVWTVTADGHASARLESSGLVLAELAAEVNGDDQGLTHVTTADGSLLATLEGGRVLYARTSAWAALRVPGGRYELVAEAAEAKPAESMR